MVARPLAATLKSRSSQLSMEPDCHRGVRPSCIEEFYCHPQWRNYGGGVKGQLGCQIAPPPRVILLTANMLFLVKFSTIFEKISHIAHPVLWGG